MKIGVYHTFRRETGTGVINGENVSAAHCNEETASLLDLVSADPGKALEPRILRVLESLDLIDNKAWSAKPPDTEQEFPVINMALLVTQECNLKCIYCYGDAGSYGSGGNMTRETAFTAVDWLIEHSRKIKKLGISFFGGEPVLNFPLIQDVVAYAEKRVEESDKQFQFHITTNASLLDAKKITFLKKHKVVPLVSFDGPKEIHDAQRPLKNGAGSYDMTVPKIRALLKVFPEAACRATLLGDTDSDKVESALHDLGFQYTMLDLASRSLFGNDTEVPKRETKVMLKLLETEGHTLFELIRERDTEKLRGLKASRSYQKMLGLMQFFINGQRQYFPCSAGRGYIAVSCRGDIYLCHRFVGIESQRLGDVFGDGLHRDAYIRSRLKTPDATCTDCFAKYLCAGGCYHENLGATDSVFEPSKEMCLMIRHAVEVAAATTCRLSQEDKAYLVRENIITKNFCPLDLF